MAPLIAAALISAASTAVSYGISNSQRNAQNAYNNPQNQMSMMMAAGINPNTAAAGIAGSPIASANSNPVQVPDIANNAQEIASADSIMKNAKADVELKEAETKYYDSLRTGKDIENEFAPERWQTMIAETISRTTKNDVDSDYVREKTRQITELFPTQKELMECNVEQVRELIKNYRKERQYKDAQIELMKTEEGLNVAQAAKANSETAINQFIIENGYAPDDPQAELIRKGCSGDEKQEKEADEILDQIVEIQDKTDEAKRENDPIVRQQQRLEKDYNADMERIDELLDKAKAELHEYEMGRKKDNFFKTDMSNKRDEVKRLEERKQRLTQNYHENLRRLRTNSSYNVMGIGENK